MDGDLQPSARAKRIKAELPGLLREMEEAGIREIRLRRSPVMGHLARFARELGVVGAGQHETDFPGSIYVTIELPTERAGGFVAETGDALAIWIGDFLREAERRDVLDKLSRSRRSQRHVFVLLPGFATAPFGVTDLLMRDGAPLPVVDPDLPEEVTHVWVASSWATGRGFRWDPERGWECFDKLIDTAA